MAARVVSASPGEIRSRYAAKRAEVRERFAKRRAALKAQHAGQRQRLKLPKKPTQADRNKLHRNRLALERAQCRERSALARDEEKARAKLDAEEKKAARRARAAREKRRRKRQVIRTPLSKRRPTNNETVCDLQAGLTVPQARRQYRETKAAKREAVRLARGVHRKELDELQRALTPCVSKAEAELGAAEDREPAPIKARRAARAARREERESERLDAIRVNLSGGALAAFESLPKTKQLRYRGTARRQPYEQFLEDYESDPDLQARAFAQAENVDWGKEEEAYYAEHGPPADIPF